MQYNEKSFIFAETPFVMDKRLTDKIVRYFATQPIVRLVSLALMQGAKLIAEAILIYL